MKKLNEKSGKMTLTIRAVAGAYLLYTAFGLYTDWEEVKPGQEILIGAAIAVFVIFGATICLFSARDLYRISRNKDNSEKDERQESGQKEETQGENLSEDNDSEHEN